MINHRAECLSIPYALFLWKASAPLGEFSSAEMLHCPTSANTHCQPPLCVSFSLSRLHSLCFCHTQRLSMCVTYCTVLSHYQPLFFLADWIFGNVLPLFPRFVYLPWGYLIWVFEGLKNAYTISIHIRGPLYHSWYDTDIFGSKLQIKSIAKNGLHLAGSVFISRFDSRFILEIKSTRSHTSSHKRPS